MYRHLRFVTTGSLGLLQPDAPQLCPWCRFPLPGCDCGLGETRNPAPSLLRRVWRYLSKCATPEMDIPIPFPAQSARASEADKAARIGTMGKAEQFPGKCIPHLPAASCARRARLRSTPQ